MSKIAKLILVKYKCNTILKELQNVNTYEEYHRLGLIYDTLRGNDVWRNKDETKLYDWRRI